MSLGFHITTMGCPKNVVDSEGMSRLLTQAGHVEVGQQQADVIIINTCGFIDAARQESLSALRHAARRKRHDQALIAVGCLVQRDGEVLAQQVAGVDALLSTRRLGEIVPVVEAVAERRGWSDRSEKGQPQQRQQSRRISAYLKIADGCDRSCAFCTIPLIKGPYQSRTVDDILADARRLAAEGAQELVLVAQETSAYGVDRGERAGLARLLPLLAEAVPDVPWLRLLYTYPSTVTPQLIEAWAKLPRLVPYLDMPLQHAHPDVLRRMKRPHDIEKTRRLLDELRAALPGLALRTTFIVGFPGETEAEFQTLLDFMSDVRFDNVGIFEFSPEEGTPAAAMPNQVPPRLRRERYDRAMLHQQEISLAKNREWMGEKLDVLIEAQAQETGRRRFQEPLFVGRSYRQAPEIDGLVFVRGRVRVGSIVKTRIERATEYDLWGTPLNGG